ncbi:MAG: THUMP domain-containing protein [Candidatus Woesearchaeota archaeon]
MMKYIATSPKGLEDVSSMEIKEIINAKAKKTAEGRVEFDTTEDKIKILAYSARSIDAIYSLVKRINFNKNFLKEVEKIEIKIEEPFMAKVWHSSEDIVSKSLAAEIGAIIHKRGLAVDLERPKTTVMADIVGNECFLGILVREGMHKRDYRVKVSNKSVNACIAYCLVRLSDYSKEKAFIDPFCKDGVTIIEAASFALNIPRAYFTDEKLKDLKIERLNIMGVDSLLHNIRSCEINSKLAGVNKAIKLSKYDIDWLDLKLGDSSVDCIATIMPYSNWELNANELTRVYKEFFRQASSILKKNGKISLLTVKPEVIKETAEGFKAKEEREVWAGQQKYSLKVFIRK